MSDAAMARRIARELAAWHRADIPGSREPMLFPTLDKWLAAVPPSFGCAKKDARFRSVLSIDRIGAEVRELQAALEAVDSPTVFCHGDLLCKNILYDHVADRCAFIDYEYAAYSKRGFDIGNHFCEFAGMEEPVNYDRYPDKAFQTLWLRYYLAAYTDGACLRRRRCATSAPARSVRLTQPPPTRCSPAAEADVGEERIAHLYREVNKFALAAHLYWGVWALVQAAYSDIPYDYLGFALVRFAEYFRRKEEFLAL